MNEINVLPSIEKKEDKEPKKYEAIEEVVEVSTKINQYDDGLDSRNIPTMGREITVEDEDTILDGISDYANIVDVPDNRDDTTPQDIKINDYEFTDEDMKNIFFGASSYHNNKKEIKKDTDLFTVFDFYRKESRYRDVYLPVTNVAVRIYEFNNLDILINKLILESEKDFNYRTQINVAGTQTRAFVEKIFENAEFLTSDREQLTPAHFELVSSLDVPFLVLAATSLMSEIYDSTNGTAGHKIDEEDRGIDIWQDTCQNEKCQQVQRLFRNVDEILRAQYTEEMIDYANGHYDPNDTLENNIKRSKKVKAKGIKYTKGNSGVETIFLMKDPDWIRGHDYDRAFDSYVINTYIDNKYIKDLPKEKGKEWLNMTNRERAAEIQERIVNLLNMQSDTEDTISLEEIRDLSNRLMLDIQNFNLTKYLHQVKIISTKEKDQNGNPTTLSVINMSDLTLEQKLIFLEKYIDDEMVEKMLTQIGKLKEFGRDTIEYKWKCVKCGHENVSNVDPILFVFLLLQSLLYKSAKALSTTLSKQSADSI